MLIIVNIRNDFLAVWGDKGSTFYLCICLQKIRKSSKNIKIRWFDEVKGASDTYTISYTDKVSVNSVLTKVHLEKADTNYVLSKKERRRVNFLLRNVEYEEV